MGLSFHAHTHCQPGRLPGDKPAKSHPWGAPLKPDVRSSRAQRTAGNLRMRSSVMTLEGASRGSGCFGQGCGKWSWRAPSAADQTGRTTHGRPKRPLAAARPPSPWPSARPLPSSSHSSQTATSDPARPSTGLIPAQPAAYNWPGSSTAQSLDQRALGRSRRGALFGDTRRLLHLQPHALLFCLFAAHPSQPLPSWGHRLKSSPAELGRRAASPGVSGRRTEVGGGHSPSRHFAISEHPRGGSRHKGGTTHLCSSAEPL